MSAGCADCVRPGSAWAGPAGAAGCGPAPPGARRCRVSPAAGAARLPGSLVPAAAGAGARPTVGSPHRLLRACGAWSRQPGGRPRTCPCRQQVGPVSGGHVSWVLITQHLLPRLPPAAHGGSPCGRHSPGGRARPATAWPGDPGKSSTPEPLSLPHRDIQKPKGADVHTGLGPGYGVAG